MNMKVSDFQNIARAGGNIQVDSDSGGLKTSGKGFFGKIASWFRAKSDPGTVAGENMSAMNSFIRALGTDRNYGPKFADMASRELSTQMLAGKPLSARTVTTMLASFDRELASVRGNAKMLGERFSTYDIHGDPNCFGSIYANLASDRGMNIDPNSMNTTKLARNISSAIFSACQQGKHPVTISEAKDIARAEIAKYLDARKELMTAIDGFDCSTGDKTALKEMVMQRPTIKDVQTVRQMLALRDDAKTMMTTLGGGTLGKSGMLDALNTFHGKFDTAFAPLKGPLTGVEDMINFADDSLAFALKTSGMSKESMQALFTNLSSESTRTLFEESIFLQTGNMTEHAKGAEMVGVLRRSQEIAMAVGVEVGLKLGMTQDQAIDAMRKPVPQCNSFAQVSTDLSSFLHDRLGMDIPDGLREVGDAMTTEIKNSHGGPTFLRSNSDGTRLMSTYMNSRGAQFMDGSKGALDTVLSSGKRGVEAYTDFMNAFLGGKTADDGIRAARNLPEPVKSFAKQIYAQVLSAPHMTENDARIAVKSGVFLRGVVPQLTMMHLSDTALSPTCRTVGQMLMGQVNDAPGSNPEQVDAINGHKTAFDAFMTELCTGE
jgi:hypothetical protein